MAELILTDEEKAAKSWLDLDDASLGRLVKATGLKLAEDEDGGRRVQGMTAAIMLACGAYEANAEKTTLVLEGVTSHGKSIGDWVVTIARKGGE